jgi:hypothetical protein
MKTVPQLQNSAIVESFADSYARLETTFRINKLKDAGPLIALRLDGETNAGDFQKNYRR